MYSKAKIFNLALQALLLKREIIDTASDKSNECAVLNQQYDVALASALADMDLDSTSSILNLEFVHDFTKDPIPNNGRQGPLWKYAYKYPDKCAFFRRLVSCNTIDDKFTHHAKRVAIYNNQKVIFTDVQYAIAELIPVDFPLQTLSAPGGITVAMRLAWQSAPLIVGKGAKSLREAIKNDYAMFKAEAQEIDSRESFSFQTDANMSEFVKVRMS